MRQPSAEEYESVRQNKKAIVLFRLTGSLDGKEVHLLLEKTPWIDSSNIVGSTVLLANLDSNEPVKRFSTYYSPSLVAAESGWGAFLLEPGTYYLSIRSGRLRDTEVHVPGFRFTVPADARLIYIGSLHLACSTKELASWSKVRIMGSCSSEATAANEIEAANLIGQDSLREFGPPSSAIMQPYGSPLAPGTISGLAPVGLLAPTSKIDLGSPEWMKRAIRIGLLPSAGLFFLAGGGAPGPGAGGAVALAILWAPVGATLGYLGGKWSESSWEPCQKALQESLSKFDPTAALAVKLKGALDNWSVAALEIGTQADGGAEASDVQSILSAYIQRIVARLCRPSSLSTTLCLEVVTRARLFDTATQTYLYDGVFIYSDGELSMLESQPYELSVTSSTTPASGRDLEAYCGEGGGEILQSDLSNALNATVNRAVQDLGLRLE